MKYGLVCVKAARFGEKNKIVRKCGKVDLLKIARINLTIDFLFGDRKPHLLLNVF